MNTVPRKGEWIENWKGIRNTNRAEKHPRGTGK